MNELVSRVTGLTYDLFGVVIPGAIAVLFFVLWWAALGDAAPYWTTSAMPQLTLSVASAAATELQGSIGIGAGVALLVASYFSGHLLLWVGRSGKAVESESALSRVRHSLRFRIPKPKQSYDPTLEPLYASASSAISLDRSALPWTQFYPVARAYLARQGATSLIATFQNKYTLHRSITTAAAGWFWLSGLSLVWSAITCKTAAPAPHWGWLSLSLLVALTLVWGFSGSYLLYWRTFGNTVIAEVYAHVRGARNGSTS